MALPNFAVYQRQNTSSLVNNGTVREQMEEAGNEGALGFIPSNFRRETKINSKGETKYNRVVILVYNGEVDPKTNEPLSKSITCSEPVSRDLRAKKITLSEVADYNIVEDENGINYISAPGNAPVIIAGNKLKTTAVSTKSTNYQDFIAL